MSYGAVDGGEFLAQTFHIEDSLAIQRASRTVNDNASGECEDCGREIPPARLRVVPMAKYCAGCQSGRDHDEPKFTFKNPYVP
jgi:phage/conjugal plasmid C-4 type zinc finger TraR family protein